MLILLEDVVGKRANVNCATVREKVARKQPLVTGMSKVLTTASFEIGTNRPPNRLSSDCQQ
jgi:hypothetical protein